MVSESFQVLPILQMKMSIVTILTQILALTTVKGKSGDVALPVRREGQFVPQKDV